MSKKVAVNEETEQAMKKLGKLLTECRGNQSLRRIAESVGIPGSQLSWIENGSLAPTSATYASLLRVLKPNAQQRSELDKQFMAIRNTPPPDVCRTVMNTAGLVDSLRAFDGESLSTSQAERLRDLLQSFASEIMKGEKNHVEDL